ncbi:hypothetical protein BGZ94_008855 [Podila epigama]|nr:hypothetical protein BGZ94_008855 [Podila epigama]
MATPLTSAIVATFYITLITLLATAQFVRSRTPLRLGSAVMAILGLSISVLSIIHSIGNIAHPVYWIYQFVAECFAVTWLITTMIHLGYAFYPTTRHQTALWRTALASVVLYDLIAVAELSYYCYRVWGLPSPPHPPIPVPWIYWLRQVIKVLAFAVTIAYLFVPLVRHHKNANVSMLADRNTLAVGTWYLTALGVTFVFARMCKKH